MATNLEVRSNPTQLKVGDRLSRVSYMEVVGRSGSNFTVKNEEGMEWSIAGSLLQNEAYCASQYTAEREVSRTEMIEALESAGDSVFTVVFDKKISQKDIVETLQALDSVPTKKTDLNKLAKSMLAGSERRMVGYLASTEPKMGRSTVVDLEVPATEHRLRLVDHRTVKELILRNVRYVLKA
jgi:hypothetical protein